jgi:hypothetical protein
MANANAIYVYVYVYVLRLRLRLRKSANLLVKGKRSPGLRRCLRPRWLGRGSRPPF